MNTFLPYPSFYRSAKCLDTKRLGKQRVEVLQMLRALHGETKGWVNHPCTKMWKDHNNALVAYGTEICYEWLRRGYKDTCLDKILIYYDDKSQVILPSWVGKRKFHKAHRSNLLRKDPIYYKDKFEKGLPDNLEYIWEVGE